MAIIVEDGSGVLGANSYASLVDLRAYAADRGLALPSSDVDCNVLLINSADLLETLRNKYKGEKTNVSNSMQWPRKCVYIDSSLEPISSASIPAELIKAQCQLAYDSSLTDLLPTGEGRQVVSEKVDVLEVHYSDQGLSSVQPVFTKALAILRPLLNNLGGFALSSVRI